MKVFILITAALFGAVACGFKSTTPSIPESLCGEYNVSILLDIKDSAYNVTLLRLCDQSRLIDFNRPEQDITVFRGFTNFGSYSDPNYGEKFILILRNKIDASHDKVTIVPERVNVTGPPILNVLVGKMIIQTHEEPEDGTHNQDQTYTNATIIPQNVHVMRPETVKLVPGWKGFLSTATEQEMVPDHGSSFVAQNVTVVPGWNLASTFYSVHAKVVASPIEYQNVTIFFKSN